MAAGDVTQGRRLPDDSEIRALERPGDYFLKDGGTILWAIHPDTDLSEDPGAGYFTIDSSWSIVENDDGTVTVSPSIWINKPTGWHGFLERGVWREV